MSADKCGFKNAFCRCWSDTYSVTALYRDQVAAGNILVWALAEKNERAAARCLTQGSPAASARAVRRQGGVSGLRQPSLRGLRAGGNDTGPGSPPSRLDECGTQ